MIIDLFSKRQKRLNGEVTDIYVYDQIPLPLRRQIIYILQDGLGTVYEYQGGDPRLYSLGFSSKTKVRTYYDEIVSILRREYGVFCLIEGYGQYNGRDELFNFILMEENVERVIDAIELVFRCIDRGTRRYEYRNLTNFNEIADNAIEELNGRFREHNVGYHFQDGKIIRINSTLIHQEVVIPSLNLLNDTCYNGVQEEFLKAHEHYRHGRHKEALNECLKSFESMMKSICNKRKWSYSPQDTASKLINTCFCSRLFSCLCTAHDSFNSTIFS